MNVQDFNFGELAPAFNDHISKSIPGLNALERQCERLSRRFIQSNSTVMDIGCTGGRLLTGIRGYNTPGRENVSYVGVDTECKFEPEWTRRRCHNLTFLRADALECEQIRNLSLAFSMFTVQFISEPDKLPLLARIHDGLRPGGALIISEKILATTGRIQDLLTFPFYDEKLVYFSAEEILDKERRLRGQMTLWYEEELRANLHQIGFKEIQLIWASFPFVSMLALK